MHDLCSRIPWITISAYSPVNIHKYFSRSGLWHREWGLSYTVWITFHVVHNHDYHTDSGYLEWGLSHTVWITLHVLHNHVYHTKAGYLEWGLSLTVWITVNTSLINFHALHVYHIINYFNILHISFLIHKIS